jgi:DNA-binding response OmpR family regulator
MKSVLIVDDEPDLLGLLGEILADSGYAVLTALDGDVAVALARDEAPDGILLDFMLPGMDGAEVVEAVRKEAARPSVPVIMMSSLDESLVQRTGAAYDAFLRKPFRVEDMLEVVRRVFGLP